MKALLLRNFGYFTVYLTASLKTNVILINKSYIRSLNRFGFSVKFCFTRSYYYIKYNKNNVYFALLHNKEFNFYFYLKKTLIKKKPGDKIFLNAVFICNFWCLSIIKLKQNFFWNIVWRFVFHAPYLFYYSNIMLETIFAFIFKFIQRWVICFDYQSIR